MLALVRRAAGHLIALNFGLQLQARSATTRIVSNNEKQWRPPPNYETFSSRQRGCAPRPNRLSSCLQCVSLLLQPSVVRRAADCGSRRRPAPRKNNNEITVEMRETGDPQRKHVAIAGRERPTFAHPSSEPASMRRFGEYAFLEDSRYARQAKSSTRLPSRRVGALRRDPDADWPRRCRGSADDQRRGWLYSAASSGARFSPC